MNIQYCFGAGIAAVGAALVGDAAFRAWATSVWHINNCLPLLFGTYPGQTVVRLGDSVLTVIDYSQVPSSVSNHPDYYRCLLANVGADAIGGWNNNILAYRVLAVGLGILATGLAVTAYRCVGKARQIHPHQQ